MGTGFWPCITLDRREECKATAAPAAIVAEWGGQGIGLDADVGWAVEAANLFSLFKL